MKRDEVIALAREAGAHWEYNRSHPVPCVFGDDGSLLRFAALVAAHEREECAKVCEQIDTAAIGGNRPAPNDCAAAIRNRDNQVSLQPSNQGVKHE